MHERTMAKTAENIISGHALKLMRPCYRHQVPGGNYYPAVLPKCRVLIILGIRILHHKKVAGDGEISKPAWQGARLPAHLPGE
ncbi:MAG: hypothetical protein IMF26_09225 [Candidatus Fermentithermobacillus carboniphilus]|uniref:Uncharacterized protein n=1 Tax=Candidatus Fermentithermobacillus carboniphilus TaxID=3085328 RepID=A0AAT9LAY5_9FIRM|nr:MAG: hypothetical protein IMF26_09225 [Candidatus Fermentithermobacillus carboniphilus]